MITCGTRQPGTNKRRTRKKCWSELKEGERENRRKPLGHGRSSLGQERVAERFGRHRQGVTLGNRANACGDGVAGGRQQRQGYVGRWVQKLRQLPGVTGEGAKRLTGRPMDCHGQYGLGECRTGNRTMGCPGHHGFPGSGGSFVPLPGHRPEISGVCDLR